MRIKEIARELVWVNDELNEGRLFGLEKDFMREKKKALEGEWIKTGISAEKLLIYMDEYRKLLFGEYNEWIKKN